MSDAHPNVDGTRGSDGPDLDLLAERLRSLGRNPVDPAVASRHLSAMGRVDVVRRLRRRLAAAVAGTTLVAGGGGLAWAGNLPAPAQEAAHDVLGAMGIEVPPGHDRVVDAEACPGGTIDPETGDAYTNHGDYVRDHPGEGGTDCGKPRKAVEHPNGDDELTPDVSAEGQGKAHGKGHGKGKPDGVGEQGEGNDETPAGPPVEIPPQAPGAGDGEPPADPGRGSGGPPASVPAGPPDDKEPGPPGGS